MTETSEQTGGFDRRSLIKKGIAFGGAAAVLPVITTFNAPAFAASTPGLRVQFRLTFLNAIGAIIVLGKNRITPTATACPAFQDAWDDASGAAPGTIVVTAALSGTILAGNARMNFTITSGNATFASLARQSGCVLGTVDTPTTASIPLSQTLDVALSDDVFIIVNAS